MTVVLSEGAQWGEGDAWRVAPDPILTIGTQSGSEEFQLVAVAAAVRQSDGGIVAVDRGARAVRLYDSRGHFVRTLGGGGSGPGEFLDPSSIVLGPGDSVAVWDGRLLRLTRFDASGALAAVETLDLARIARALEPPLYPGSVEPLADGGFLVRIVEKSAKTPPSGMARLRSGALRVSADLSSIDTLMFFGDTAKIAVDAPFGRWPIAPPLAMGPVVAHKGNPPRVCIGGQTGPEILCIVPAGGRVLLRWVWDPGPVSDEEVRAWREANLRLFGEKLREEDILRMLEQVPTPSVRPDYSDFTLDGGGNLWVRIGPRGGVKSVEYLVFDPNGVLLGPLTVPPLRILEIGADFLLGVSRDEVDVERLHLFEIEKTKNALDRGDA